MKKLFSALVLAIVFGFSASASDLNPLIPKELGDKVLFEGEIVSSNYHHDDSLNFRSAMRELLIRFEKKFYHCRLTENYRECYEFGKKYWLHD